MPNWSESMQQTFEYYVVDPNTWADSKKLDTVKSCSITRDSGADTLGSATIDITGSIGECYVRVYLITIQNGVREKFPLGTFLVQTPSMEFDGKIDSVSLDAYTPLIELKENPPPIGYYIRKDENILRTAYTICREHVRAPVVESSSDDTLFNHFVSDQNDTWLVFLNDLLGNAKNSFELDEMGRILFAPKQDAASMQPVWTFNDDNSSILYPSISVERDLYGIPNVVEVIYSNGTNYYYSRKTNDDPSSPTSTVSRGREILYRETNPNVIGDPTYNQIDEYAEQLLKDMSTVEYSVSYTHGYCPVRVGDCVRLNYQRAGLRNIKAKVVSQSISCVPGAPVSERAVFSSNLMEFGKMYSVDSYEVEPEGTINITKNGTYDVTQYQFAMVFIPTYAVNYTAPEHNRYLDEYVGKITPYGSATYNSNGEYNVSRLRTITVSIPVYTGDTPEEGVYQVDDTLYIISGVNVSQSGDTLSIT